MALLYPQLQDEEFSSSFQLERGLALLHQIMAKARLHQCEAEIFGEPRRRPDIPQWESIYLTFQDRMNQWFLWKESAAGRAYMANVAPGAAIWPPLPPGAPSPLSADDRSYMESLNKSIEQAKRSKKDLDSRCLPVMELINRAAGSMFRSDLIQLRQTSRVPQDEIREIVTLIKTHYLGNSDNERRHLIQILDEMPAASSPLQVLALLANIDFIMNKLRTLHEAVTSTIDAVRTAGQPPPAPGQPPLPPIMRTCEPPLSDSTLTSTLAMKIETTAANGTITNAVATARAMGATFGQIKSSLLPLI